MAEAFERNRAEGVVRDQEFDLVCKDGALLPVVCSALLVRDESGAAVPAEVERTAVTW